MAKTVSRKSATAAHPDRGALRDALWNLAAQLRDVRDADKVLRAALRLAMDYFAAPQGCVAAVRPGGPQAEILLPTPRAEDWDAVLLADFLRGYKVAVPGDTMLARIRRHGRMWGTLVVRRGGADFQWEAREAFSWIGATAAELTDRVDQQRIHEVRARIDQKVLEQLRPKDLFYQVLDGIRSLVAYDHSAALLVCDQGLGALEVVAEQIAWKKKVKSQRVGLKLPLSPALAALLRRAPAFGFDRHALGWNDWTDTDAAALAELLDYNRSPDGEAPQAEGTMLCAPLISRDTVLGVLKVGAVHAGTYGRYEAELVARFLPQAAVALQHLRRTESLELQVLAAERKHAMADLARGVAHDVNNALGAVVPLVQQLREDAEGGQLDPRLAAADLAEIDRALGVCRRIFGGMLGFARSLSAGAGEVYLHREVEATLGMLRDGLARRGIAIAVEVPATLPPLRGIQADVEQLLLNLLTNARDALEGGGQLAIRAAAGPQELELVVEDTGCGIPPEHLSRIEEPFFTTKPAGSGLGLAICRSIVSQMHGRMSIKSQVGRGTAVRIVFPLPEDEL